MPLYKLMIKTHRVTGRQYVSFTARKDHDNYKGSGVLWLRHLNKHGKDVHTEVIYQTEDYNEFVKHATEFSEVNGVGSDLERWANLVPETGTGGSTSVGKIWITDGVKDKTHSKNQEIPDGWRRGRSTGAFCDAKIQKELSAKASKYSGKTHSEETKIKMRKSALSRAPVSEMTGNKISAKLKGVKKSDKHRAALKEGWARKREASL